jgi:hypothetical protein
MHVAPSPIYYNQIDTAEDDEAIVYNINPQSGDALQLDHARSTKATSTPSDG